MREVLPQLSRWHAGGVPFALATVVGVRGSAPREPGAVMAVAESGEVVGSVSGGCVEGAVYEAATAVLESGTPRLESYGVSDDDAFAAGLTCGGHLDVLVRRVEAAAPLGQVLSSLARQEPVAVATVTGGPAPLGAQRYVWRDRATGTLGSRELDRAVTDDARGLLTVGVSGSTGYQMPTGRQAAGPTTEQAGVRPDAARTDARSQTTVFVQSFAPPPRMLVFGAIDFAGAVARMGAFLGYRVTVCDARPVFATEKRFPDAHEVVCAWPHDYLARTEIDERTVVCVLTHDPKFDIPLLTAAVRTSVAYIGVMGSRRTHADRVARLRAEGIDEASLTRLAAPVGLDLGGHTPEETAVAIAAEIVQRRRGGTGMPLSCLTGAIHRRDGTA
ncbi:XdhC family protein [Streptomyces sp. NPDC056165]|uniref:XdhC family protein n=1 Tax=Streptomyces sp. NPDC056165 TaxID=3345733 RepID=UPI0035D83F7B